MIYICDDISDPTRAKRPGGGFQKPSCAGPHLRLLRFSVLGWRCYRHILDLSSLHLGGQPEDYMLAANPRRAS
jgi:hypothetical protein